jgi:hypothetical protein
MWHKMVISLKEKNRMPNNYKQTLLLVEKMKEYLDIPIYGNSGLLKFLGEQNDIKLQPNHEFTIDTVMYVGDDGGIMCMLKSEEMENQVFSVSLSFLKVADDHPLADEIRSYQKRQAFELALEDGKKVKRSNSTKKKKGFGV